MSEPSRVGQLSPSSDPETQAAAAGVAGGSQRGHILQGDSVHHFHLGSLGQKWYRDPSTQAYLTALSGQEEGSQDGETLPPAARGLAHRTLRVVCLPGTRGRGAPRGRLSPCGAFGDNAVIRGTHSPCCPARSSL